MVRCALCVRRILRTHRYTFVMRFLHVRKEIALVEPLLIWQPFVLNLGYNDIRPGGETTRGEEGRLRCEYYDVRYWIPSPVIEAKGQCITDLLRYLHTYN